MAKTITEYEASDIDIEGNELYKMLDLFFLLATLSYTGAKDKTPEGLKNVSRVTIANLLNLFERAGYSVAKKEVVPPVFNDIFGGPAQS